MSSILTARNHEKKIKVSLCGCLHLQEKSPQHPLNRKPSGIQSSFEHGGVRKIPTAQAGNRTSVGKSVGSQW
jgi:hypothetical protein